MTILVVIVTYNSTNVIGSCLDALDRVRNESAHAVRSVVVDNASSDGTASLVRERWPWVEVLESGGNVGFGRAVNLGVAHASDNEAVLLLNPDAELEPTDFDALVHHLAVDPLVGAVAPAMVLPGGRRGISGGPRPSVRKEVLASLGVDRLVGPRARAVLAGMASRHPGLAGGLLGHLATMALQAGPIEVDWVCGFCCLVRMEAWRSVDGFDPRYFLYFEDVDLCLRLRRNGWRIDCLTTASCFHDESSSTRSSGKQAFQREGFGMFLKLHGSARERLAARVLLQGAWAA